MLLCVDYWVFNQIIQFEAETITDPEAGYVRHATAKFFAKIDLSKGYCQIFIKVEDQPKTGFQTTKSLFQWIRMPFVLVAASATFARVLRSLHLVR